MELFNDCEELGQGKGTCNFQAGPSKVEVSVEYNKTADNEMYQWNMFTLYDSHLTTEQEREHRWGRLCQMILLSCTEKGMGTVANDAFRKQLPGK